MENLLQQYLSDSFQKREDAGRVAGLPIVTLSREYGCPSKLIGLMLTDAINRKIPVPEHRWRFINKEILEEAAKDLHIPATQVNSLLSADEKGMLLDLVTFSTTYGGSLRIRRTVRKVVENFAARGRCVIVGRGAVAITRNYPNSLHIRLHAAVEWRTREVAAHHGCSEADARKLICEIDQKRLKLIESLLGKDVVSTLFDVSYNCQFLEKEEIVQSIMCLLESRKMVR